MAYEMIENGKIRCLQCGLISCNPADVENRWCPLCHMSHDEYDRSGLESGRPKTPFEAGERVYRRGFSYVVVSNEGFYGRARDANGADVFPFYWFHEGEWSKRA